MQITLQLPPDLENNLIQQAHQLNIPLETLILQTLRQITPPTPSAQWPDLILSYLGEPDFPAFESYREELLPPSKPELL